MKKLLAPALALIATGAFAASAQAVPHSNAQGLSHRDVCAVPAAAAARCFAKVVTTSDGQSFNGAPDATTGTPAGWGPADLQSAYKLTGLAPLGTPTVAIVDAYDDPNAESDLATYRSQYGLPACSTANGCFKKVNQNGVQGSYPAGSSGWAEEIALDLDMVSSACPACNILLVEGNSNSFADLMTAEDTAASSGAVAVSNSYGANEFSGETSYDSHFNHPGVAVTVSSGDSGYGAEYPAASSYVTSAGGTSLSRSTSTARGWSETAWSGAGSGCSSYETKPSWQHDTACSRRTIADVSSVSDPNTGVAVYNTYAGDPGWMVFGGTSAAAPFIAGVYAVGGVRTGVYESSLPYGATGSLFDVTSGINGRCYTKRTTSTKYLCTAGVGYDGPTGLGTPNGIGAF